MRATSIQLYSRRLWGDAGEPAYCGCWAVPCPDGDPRIPDLERLNLGRALAPDGSITRSFFFADEIGEMVARAERETECLAETPWEFGPVEATVPALGLVPARHRASLAKLRRDVWIGAREGIAGNTQEALARLGVAEIREETKPYRRSVARLTDLGARYLEAHGKPS